MISDKEEKDPIADSDEESKREDLIHAEKEYLYIKECREKADNVK